MMPGMSQAENGVTSVARPTRAESRVLIVGTLAALPFWVVGLLAIGNANAHISQGSGSATVIVAVAGFLVIAVGLEVVRSRIRRRSGRSAFGFSSRNEWQLMRAAAAESGWPSRLVEAVLLIAALGCAALFAFTIFHASSG